jgi:hypothetical protein
VKIIYSVWYGCHEETGQFGYYETEVEAASVLASVQEYVGKWTRSGDCIQAVGMSEIILGSTRDDVLQEDA